MSKKAILIKNLVKDYNKGGGSGGGGGVALSDLTMSVPQGSVFGLLGPNGAGKSTLINILSGTVIKTSGKVVILDTDIDQFPKKARSLLGIVPQEIIFDTFFPIQQALEFTAGYFGIRPKFRKTKQVLKALSLWDKRKNFPQQLSGGMKRRFLIAKALVHSPAVLVLDEPTAGVDIELRIQLWDYVKELNRQGMTIIITTHYLTEAEEMCDKIAFMNKGKIIKQDSKQNLFKNLGTKHIDVEFNEAVVLEEINFSEKIVVESICERKLRFYLDSKKTDYFLILKEINSINKEIKDLTISQSSLEDIFHKIM